MPYEHVKKGWFVIGGKRYYFKSEWERNVALYLEWLKTQGDISDWEYEPKVFWFDGVKRGITNYTPDFRITENDGSKEYWEVKGYIDRESKTKLRRMAKYYPDVRLTLIDAPVYKDIMRWFPLFNKEVAWQSTTDVAQTS